MQKISSRFMAICSSAGMLILILDSKTAIRAAIDGLELCFYSIIPALFPFFLFSTLLTGVLHGQKLYIPGFLRNALGIPYGGEALLFAGLLGGYPLGAHCVAQAYRSGGISKKDAGRMLGYCVNAGPAFIFGICSVLFTKPIIPWLLWFIHIFSALLTASVLPGKRTTKIAAANESTVSVPVAFRTAIKNMAQVCGWVVMARVLTGFFDRWILWLCPNDLRAVLLSAIELTNGCTELTRLPSEALRFILCSAALAFGGTSVYMQVCSVTGRLGTGMYIQGKLLQCIFSSLLAFILHYALFPTPLSPDRLAVPGLLVGAAITSLIPFAAFYKKSGSFSAEYHV